MPRVIMVASAVEATVIQEITTEYRPVTGEDLPDAVLYRRMPVEFFDDDDDPDSKRPLVVSARQRLEALLERIERPRVWQVPVEAISTRRLSVDPLLAEVRWRTDCRWDRASEIEEWVEQNARRDVLVQGIPDGWLICPLCYEDENAMRHWVTVQTKQNLIVLPTGPEGAIFRHRKVIDWAKENLRGEWFDASTKDRSFSAAWVKEIRLMIRRDADAVLTKMRWAEDDAEVE